MSMLSILIASMTLAPAADAPKEGKGDQERLQGAWKVVSMVNDGKEAPADKIKGAKLIFESNRYTMKGGDEAFRGTFKLNETKALKQIDTTFVGEDNKERGTARGVYELEGKRLRICWRQEGGERPTELTSKPDSGVRLVVLERE